MSGVLTVLLLVSGCARRVPRDPLQEDPQLTCHTRAVHFEQTGGACAPFPRFELAVELLGERCDEATLAQARQRLQQEPGLEQVDVARGERVPGTDRHPVLVRYASPEPGTCPSERKYPRGYCEDCPVQQVFLMLPPLDCPSRPFSQSVIREVKERVPTCKAEHLDAARLQVWRQGWFSSVQVNCVTNDEDLTQLVVNVDVADPGGVCKAFKSAALKPRCPEAPSECTYEPSCRTDSNGCQACTCESQLSKLVQFLLGIPAALLTR